MGGATRWRGGEGGGRGSVGRTLLKYFGLLQYIGTVLFILVSRHETDGKHASQGFAGVMDGADPIEVIPERYNT